MELSLPLSRRMPRRGATSSTRVRHGLAWPLGRLASNRLVLRAVLCALLAVPLLGGGWLWLRDSSLASVRHVRITGVQGVDGVEIRTALDDAAVRMTTLDFSTAALRSAVAQFPIVGALNVSTSFPHSVSIDVVERSAVAALLSAGQHTAVAADGTVLGPGSLSSSLPTIDGSVEPSAGARLHEPAALAAVAVLAAAPASLARFAVRAYDGPQGLTVAMRNGLLVYFGDATRPHAKWLSLARVLVSPSAAGASYVDVRLPERPAAGFSSLLSSTSTPAQAGASAQTAATLVAGLEAAIGGTPTASAAPSEPSSSNPSEASAMKASEASSPGETGTGSAPAGNEASSPGSSEASLSGLANGASPAPGAGG
jgi:cell division protein FtsQ